MTHKYVSTYCHHDDHSACRLHCKTCKNPCLCGCHLEPEYYCLDCEDFVPTAHSEQKPLHSIKHLYSVEGQP